MSCSLFSFYFAISAPTSDSVRNVLRVFANFSRLSSLLLMIRFSWFRCRNLGIVALHRPELYRRQHVAFFRSIFALNADAQNDSFPLNRNGNSINGLEFDIFMRRKNNNRNISVTCDTFGWFPKWKVYTPIYFRCLRPRDVRVSVAYRAQPTHT